MESMSPTLAYPNFLFLYFTIKYFKFILKSWLCNPCCCSVVSHVQLFVTPWTAACQAPLSFTIPWSLLKFMSIGSVMWSNYLILCHPLFLFEEPTHWKRPWCCNPYSSIPFLWGIQLHVYLTVRIHFTAYWCSANILKFSFLSLTFDSFYGYVFKSTLIFFHHI